MSIYGFVWFSFVIRCMVEPTARLFFVINDGFFLVVGREHGIDALVWVGILNAFRIPWPLFVLVLCYALLVAHEFIE